MWKWSKDCQNAFDKVKQMISTDHVLWPYDPLLPLILDCDASSYSLGAVLSHWLPNGTERPVAFASCMMSETEKKYAQIDREALSIIFLITKFHTYLYVRTFTLCTNHKPLIPILGSKKGIPSMAVLWMQQWAMTLRAYSYNIEYRPLGQHCNADVLAISATKHLRLIMQMFYRYSNSNHSQWQLNRWDSKPHKTLYSVE